MNIFWLSFQLAECARWHCDKHCVKMILETAQLLFTALHKLYPEFVEKYKKEMELKPYKKTHENHPCAKWARESKCNYLTLCDLGLELCKEYTHRYEKTHKCEPMLEWLKANAPDFDKFDKKEFTVPPMAMPDKYKVIPKKKTKEAKLKAVKRSYQIYYQNDKAELAKWKNRNTPDWWK